MWSLLSYNNNGAIWRIEQKQHVAAAFLRHGCPVHCSAGSTSSFAQVFNLFTSLLFGMQTPELQIQPLGFQLGELLPFAFAATSRGCQRNCETVKPMENEDQVVYRDAFLGNVQKKGREVEAIRFPLVATICRPSHSFSVPAFRDILQSIYCSRGCIDIIAEKQSKFMLMFSDDGDARTAYEELHDQTIQDAIGPVLKFSIWSPVDDLGYDVADHHIYVSISGLPMHLWKESVVEQILHPYCGLSYLSEETMARRNLSSYTAFGWSQKRIAMPRRISLKVSKEISGNMSLVETDQYKEVSTYSLSIDAVGFLCDNTTECSCNLEGLNVRYEGAYDPDNARCFLTEPVNTKDLINELKHAVVATAPHPDHGYQKEEVQELLSSYLGCNMKAHSINDTQFLILAQEQSVRETAKEILLQKESFTLSLTCFKLDHWKQSNMSVVERLPMKISVTVNEIPAHLCIPEIVRFVLSPYCAAEITTDRDTVMTTAERFTCTAWTDSPRQIPQRIMAGLLGRQQGTQDMEHGYSSTDLRITQLLVETTVLQGNHNA